MQFLGRLNVQDQHATVESNLWFYFSSRIHGSHATKIRIFEVTNLATKIRIFEVTNLDYRSCQLKFSIDLRDLAQLRCTRSTNFTPPPQGLASRLVRSPNHTRTTHRSDQKQQARANDPGTCVCKSDGSTNLSGRLSLGHGHWVSHVPRRRVGEAPRHGRRATALYHAERSQGLAAKPA